MMERVFRHPVLWLSATLFWVGALWYFSSLPGGSGPKWDFPHTDKILHYVCFSGGGFLVAGLVVSLSGDRINWTRVLRITVLLTALLGWLDEWHQCQVPGRSGADPWDWLADILGGATGALVVRMFFGFQAKITRLFASRQPEGKPCLEAQFQSADEQDSIQ